MVEKIARGLVEWVTSSGIFDEVIQQIGYDEDKVVGLMILIWLICILIIAIVLWVGIKLLQKLFFEPLKHKMNAMLDEHEQKQGQ